MITLDQTRIDAPDFPRGQDWWDYFLPVWIAATLDGDLVRLEPSGKRHAGPLSKIVDVPLTAAQRRRQEDLYRRHLPARLAVAIVEEVPA